MNKKRKLDSVEVPALPLLESTDPDSEVEFKPSWRGWLHAGISPIALVLGIVLIIVADGAAAKTAAAVFMASSLLLFGNSAVYHRFHWGAKVKALLRRIDHANIMLLIAGTYTPIATLALPPQKGAVLLIVVWSGALLGILFRVFWLGAPRWLYVAMYLALGWAAVMYLPDLFRANPAMMILVAAGGLLYTLGAVAYGMKKPNPWPNHFGFHEIFHLCTVLAFLCHWVACLLITLNPVSPSLGA